MESGEHWQDIPVTLATKSVSFVSKNKKERGGFMELDATLWSGLPFELVERVLSSLPVPDLCRYRSVCKTWNRLIRSPKFGAIYAQSAAKRDASFLAMRCGLGAWLYAQEGWCFFDLDARRWYTVKDHHPKLPKLRGTKPLLGCSLAVMDGGLVCRFVKRVVPSRKPFNDREAPRFSIIVYNPIAKTMKELPSVPGHLKARDYQHGYPTLHLVVDNISQQFKVFLINRDVCATFAPSVKIQNDPLMRVYDSTTNEWQGSTNPFCVSTRGVGSVSSTVMLQGFLYVLFGSCRGYLEGHVADIENEIWRYNIGEGAWEKVNVDIDAKLSSIQLFASADRLFRIGWSLSRSAAEQCRLEVSEIKIPEMVLERLFEMSKADTVDFFDAQGSPAYKILEIVAAGFGNSIVLVCKLSQNMMVLDLETRLWDRLPANPVWTQPRDGFYSDFNSYFENPNISNLNLILPSSLWYQEGEGAADEEQVMLMKQANERANRGGWVS